MKLIVHNTNGSKNTAITGFTVIYMDAYLSLDISFGGVWQWRRGTCQALMFSCGFTNSIDTFWGCISLEGMKDANCTS